MPSPLMSARMTMRFTAHGRARAHLISSENLRPPKIPTSLSAARSLTPITAKMSTPLSRIPRLTPRRLRMPLPVMIRTFQPAWGLLSLRTMAIKAQMLTLQSRRQSISLTAILTRF